MEEKGSQIFSCGIAWMDVDVRCCVEIFGSFVDTLAIKERMDSVFAKSWTLSIKES